jgi:hypothetical protein
VIVFDNRPSENRAAFVAVAYDKEYACTGSGICKYKKSEKGLKVVSGGGYNAGDGSKHYGIDMRISTK